MDILEGIRQRRSVRAYKADPVPAAVLEQLIRAATQAPSAMDEEPWRFTVVTNKALLAEISEKAKAFMLDAARGSSLEARFADMLANREYQIFYNAPVLVVISAPATLQWATEDCALAAQNLMLAACARGLGSCWIGFAQAWLNTQSGRAAIELDSGQRVVAPVIIGYPQDTASPVARRAPTIHWIK